MTTYEAPAKLNLSLHVMPPGPRGYHPLESIVQTVEWSDGLSVEIGEGTDVLEVQGSALEVEGNLVLRALSEARADFDVPFLSLVLEKRLPVASGLGGGSSDAAATLLAVGDIAGNGEVVSAVAARVGADVPLFLTGGTLRMTGFGEEIEPMRPLDDFAVAVVVPEFGLDTAEVYEQWDSLEGPESAPVADDELPPSLRGVMPMRNDLLPAALELKPRLGDFMADIRSVWGTAVCLTGSGSACFGYFASIDEARDAASSVSDICAVATGVTLRDHGVARISVVDGNRERRPGER